MPNTRITNQQLYDELKSLRETEIAPIRVRVMGNGDPEKGLCWEIAETKKLLEDHIKRAEATKKTILGVPADVRSELWKWFIRSGNVITWLILAWLINWFSHNGVKIAELLNQIPGK